MPSVFISYCHDANDEATLQEILTLLAPLQREGLSDVWVDCDIPPGADWEQAIEAALGRASVAVLLISPKFMKSEFICNRELPRIFARQARGELHVLPVFLKRALVNVELTLPGVARRVKLSSFQGYGTPERPLSDYGPSERERELHRLATMIWSLVAPRAPLPSGAAQTPGEAARREFELRVRLWRQDDRIHVQYDRPGRGLLDNVERSTPVKPALDIAQALEEARPGVLAQRVSKAATDWGPKLFEILFPDWRPVLRWVYERHAGGQDGLPDPTPTHGALRVWIASDDALLRGLPWRLTAWDGQLLFDRHWTFAVTHSRALLTREVTTLAPESILVVTDQAGADDVQEAVRHVWGTSWAPVVARTRQEAQAALHGTPRPHIVYVHGAVADIAGRPSLVLRREPGLESIPVVELERWLRAGASSPALLYLNVSREENVSVQAVDPLLDAVPLVLWRRLPERAPDSATRALMWLRHWLREACDPVAAWHGALWEVMPSSPEAATVVIQADYHRWETQRPATPLQSAVRLILDRRTPKALLASEVNELVDNAKRRVLAVVAYATPGHSVEHFAEQAEHHLQGGVGTAAPITKVSLTFPQSRDELSQDLQQELRRQLRAGNGESLAAALRHHTRGQGFGRARPILWLDWGTFGGKHAAALGPTELTDWVRVGADSLARECPADLRVIWSLALELDNATECDRIAAFLDELRMEPWYEHEPFRLCELGHLERVPLHEIRDFLAARSDCPRELTRELSQLIHKKTAGDFDRLVRLFEEGQSGSWYALADQLRAPE